MLILNQNDLFDLERDFKPFVNYDNESKKVMSLTGLEYYFQRLGLWGQIDLLLNRRESIQVAFIYICENWTD